jgi:hypothetical protein
MREISGADVIGDIERSSGAIKQQFIEGKEIT